MACPIEKVGDIYFPDVNDNDDNVSGDNVDNADQINDTSNGFRLLHQNDIKTSLQRTKRLEKPIHSVKLNLISFKMDWKVCYEIGFVLQLFRS